MSDEKPHDAGFNPMGMMKKMMGQMEEGGMMPMQMCRMMTDSVARAAEMATWATPELRALFDDWAGQVKEELLAQLATAGDTLGVDDLAERLHVGVESATFLLFSLAREGKVKLRVSPILAKEG